MYVSFHQDEKSDLLLQEHLKFAVGVKGYWLHSSIFVRFVTMKFFRNLFFGMYLFCTSCVAQQQATHKYVASNATSSENYQSMTFNGVWSWFSDPRAVYFEGKYKRTYAGWIDNYGDVHIGYYDHDTKQIASKVIYDNLEIDDHDNPTILFDDDGRLIVFFNTHLQDASPLYMRTSVNPEDISEWSPVKELFLNDTLKIRSASAMHHTYTNPVRLSAEDGKLYLFWRGTNLKPSYAVSADRGNTWSKGQILFLPDEVSHQKAPYTKVYSDGISKIHFTFTDGHPTKEAKNGLYYMYYENGAFYKANGQKIKQASQLPIFQSELDVILESETIKSWNWDIAQDANGNPIVTYVKFPNEKTHIYTYATFQNGQWKSYEVVDAGGWFPKTRSGTREPEPHYAGGIVIDHETPNTIYLSAKRDSIFEIEQWTTNNHGESWEVQKITTNSTKDNVRPFAVRGAKKGNPLQVLWLQNTNYIYYAHDTRGKGIPIDFNERYQTAVKMNLRKPTLKAEVTKENLKVFLREMAEQLLENPDYSLHQNGWEYGLRFASIEAFYELTQEARYKNELVNIQQYQTEEQEDVDEDEDEFQLFNIIWSYMTKNDRNALQQLESLSLKDFNNQEVSLSCASEIRAIEKFENEILTIDSLKADCTKYADDIFLEVLKANYDVKLERVEALMIYSVAAGMRIGLFDKKYRIDVLSRWEYLQEKMLRENIFPNFSAATKAAILLAGTEVFQLLEE